MGGALAEGVFKREQVLHILAVDLLLPVPAEVRPQLLPQPGPLPALQDSPVKKDNMSLLWGENCRCRRQS